MGRLSHREEETEALEGDGSGSSIQKDPKARCTDVGYLESWVEERREPRLLGTQAEPVGSPFPAHGLGAGSRVQPGIVN